MAKSESPESGRTAEGQVGDHKARSAEAGEPDNRARPDPTRSRRLLGRWGRTTAALLTAAVAIPVGLSMVPSHPTLPTTTGTLITPLVQGRHRVQVSLTVAPESPRFGAQRVIPQPHVTSIDLDIGAPVGATPNRGQTSHVRRHFYGALLEDMPAQRFTALPAGVTELELHQRHALVTKAAPEPNVRFGNHNYLIWSREPVADLEIAADALGLGWAESGSAIQVSMPSIGASLVRSPGSNTPLDSLRQLFSNMPSRLPLLRSTAGLVSDRTLAIPERLSPDQLETAGGQPPDQAVGNEWQWRGLNEASLLLTDTVKAREEDRSFFLAGLILGIAGAAVIGFIIEGVGAATQ